jgi:predicted glycosyltransferase
MSMEHGRLDIMLYGHDGRGLGHVSRSVAIGLALRRIYPHLKVCLLTGCRRTQELIGDVPLDWIKLPAYDTVVTDGKSTGIESPAGFEDQELGKLRAEQIGQLVSLYRPRLILADHTPQGKHRELVPALEQEAEDRPRWVLGMRGVVGSVAQVGSGVATELYQRYFSALLWYGDASVLGNEHLAALADRFATEPVECGYVSRLIELVSAAHPSIVNRYGCTISIPWFGEHTDRFFDRLIEAIGLLGPDFGRFRIFAGHDDISTCRQKLEGLDFCTLERFGPHYVESLYSSRSAVVFGGYNSLVDVLSLGIPTLAVMRDMRDHEQQEHLETLIGAVGHRLTAILENECSVEQLYTLLADRMKADIDPFALPVNLGGAEKAARTLAALL